MSDIFQLGRTGEVLNPLAPGFDPTAENDLFDGTGSSITGELYKTGLQALQVGELALTTAVKPIDALAGSELENAIFASVEEKAEKIRRVDDMAYLQGTGARILGQVFGFLPKLVAGPVSAGVLTGIPRTTAEVSMGTDLRTATALGASEGVFSAAGVAIPAAIGKTILQKGLYGVSANVGFGVTQRAAEKGLLPDDRAAGFPVFDTTSLVADAVIGGFAGAIAGSRAKIADQPVPETGPAPDSKTVDAAMAVTANDSLTNIAKATGLEDAPFRQVDEVATRFENEGPSLTGLDELPAPKPEVLATFEAELPRQQQLFEAEFPDMPKGAGVKPVYPSQVPLQPSQVIEAKEISVAEGWNPVNQDGQKLDMTYEQITELADLMPDERIEGLAPREFLERLQKPTETENVLRNVTTCILGAVNG